MKKYRQSIYIITEAIWVTLKGVFLLSFMQCCFCPTLLSCIFILAVRSSVHLSISPIELHSLSFFVFLDYFWPAFFLSLSFCLSHTSQTLFYNNSSIRIIAIFSLITPMFMSLYRLSRPCPHRTTTCPCPFLLATRTISFTAIPVDP